MAQEEANAAEGKQAQEQYVWGEPDDPGAKEGYPAGGGDEASKGAGQAPTAGAADAGHAAPCADAAGGQEGYHASASGGSTTQEEGCTCEDTGHTQQGGPAGTSAYAHAQTGYQGVATQGPAFPGPNPGAAAPWPANWICQEPYYGAAGQCAEAAGPQGMSGQPGMAGGDCTGQGKGSAGPQGAGGQPGMPGSQGMPPGMTGHAEMAGGGYAGQGMGSAGPQGAGGQPGMPGPQGMPPGMTGHAGMADGGCAGQGMGSAGPQGATGQPGMGGPQGMPPGMTGHAGMAGGGCMGQGMGSAGFQGMPGHPGMAGYPGMSPGKDGHHCSCQASHGSAGAAHAAYHQPQGPGQMPGHAPHSYGHHPAGGMGHPPHDAHQYNQFMGLVNDLANGNADPSRVMAFLGTLDTPFWKGALMGVAATLLLTNDTVKNAIAGTLGGIFGAFSKESEEE